MGIILFLIDETSPWNWKKMTQKRPSNMHLFSNSFLNFTVLLLASVKMRVMTPHSKPGWALYVIFLRVRWLLSIIIQRYLVWGSWLMECGFEFRNYTFEIFYINKNWWITLNEWTLLSNGYIFPFLLAFSFSSFLLFVRPPLTTILPFLHFFFLGMVLITSSYTMSQTSIHNSSGTLSDLIPWICLSLP